MSALSEIKISKPTYDDVIPSTGVKVKLTPFRVGDEKTLLIAGQSENIREMTNALKSVIGNCVSPVDVNQLAPYDLEYLFLKLRAKSVGEYSNIGVGCVECGAMNEIKVDLEAVIVEKNQNHNDFVKIEDALGFKMKNADVDDLIGIDLEDVESLMDIIVLSVKEVYYGEEVIQIEEGDRKELKSLLESMTSNQFEKIKDYFDTMPRLKKDIQFECGACGHNNEQTLQGLSSFF